MRCTDNLDWRLHSSIIIIMSLLAVRSFHWPAVFTLRREIITHVNQCQLVHTTATKTLAVYSSSVSSIHVDDQNSELYFETWIRQTIDIFVSLFLFSSKTNSFSENKLCLWTVLLICTGRTSRVNLSYEQLINTLLSASVLSWKWSQK